MIIGQDVRKSITSHYIVHWGVPGEIHPLKIEGGEFAILEFPPRQVRPWCVLATNGMSRYVQTQHGNSFRTELCLYTNQKQDWMFEMLEALICYPEKYDTSFVEFDTIPLERPIDGNQSVFTALMLVPPRNDANSLGVINGHTIEPMYLMEVIGLYETELDYSLEQGGKSLWERLASVSQTAVIDAFRSPVIF